MARTVLMFALFALCLLMALPNTEALSQTYTTKVKTTTTTDGTVVTETILTCSSSVSVSAGSYLLAQIRPVYYSTPTYSISLSGRKRSVSDGDGDDFMDRMLNSTNEDMFQLWDANCDGYVDVMEWVETANGSPEDFVTILNKFDSNGDSRFTYEEVLTMTMVINPNLEQFMFMPMEEYEDMKEMADKGRGESSQESPKERKTDE